MSQIGSHPPWLTINPSLISSHTVALRDDGPPSALQQSAMQNGAHRACSRYNMQVCSVASACTVIFTNAGARVPFSHNFCLPCARQFGFVEANGAILPGTGRHLACPACMADLPGQDDAVITHLNPNDDYKTSILSGLSPSTIMECAGRALSFWAYQATQEMHFQRHLYTTMTEKYSALAAELNRRTSEANSKISSLQSKLQTTIAEYEILQQKNEDLVLMYKDKCRKLLQTQEAHDREKRKAELGQLRQAASAVVDSDLQNTGHTTQQIVDGALQDRGSRKVQNHSAGLISGHEYESIASMNSSLPRAIPRAHGVWDKQSLVQPRGSRYYQCLRL
ncbi:unnamed protein product [Clonostachys solani]|uniref:RING-type domain-containing protein n=1 Tax=Clonostachys solani TaxID=160281 RepID=A0A9N9ZEN2_9HYPO|nr:unnamed protein product [Clonostachys solani]